LQQQRKVCSVCGSNKTYINKRGYEEWYCIKDNNGVKQRTCINCYQKKHYEEHRQQKIEYQYKYRNSIPNYNEIDHILRRDYKKVHYILNKQKYIDRAIYWNRLHKQQHREIARQSYHRKKFEGI
jgi:hypothetical protein